VPLCPIAGDANAHQCCYRCVCLPGLPWGRDFYPHTQPTPYPHPRGSPYGTHGRPGVCWCCRDVALRLRLRADDGRPLRATTVRATPAEARSPGRRRPSHPTNDRPGRRRRPRTAASYTPPPPSLTYLHGSNGRRWGVEPPASNCYATPNKFQETLSGHLECKKILQRPGPQWGSLKRSSGPLSWWGGGWLPSSPKSRPRLFGPRG